MVHEYLLIGSHNAKTGAELASILHVNIRQITMHVERERRQGYPICADMKRGYYLAGNEQELQAYCKRIYGRAAELIQTHTALKRILHTRYTIKEENIT